jgi:hypothetical protein
MSKQKIYKITSNHIPGIFIGNTERTLKEVLEDHESNYNRYLKDNNNNYCTSFELLKQPTYDIELVAEVTSEEEVSEIKGYHIKNTENCINKHVAGRTLKEWQQDNSEHRLEVTQEYYEKNKEKIKEQKKEYRKNNKEKIAEKKREMVICECSGTYSSDHKTRHTQTTKHQNFINNIIKEKKKRDIIDCECSGTYTSGQEKKHFASEKHQKFMKDKEQ